MRYLAANDLQHLSFTAMPAPPGQEAVQAPDDPIPRLHKRLEEFLRIAKARDGAHQEPNPPAAAKIFRQFIPQSRYPRNWSQTDFDDFTTYWNDDIQVLSVTQGHAQGSNEDKNSSPTVLSVSQRVYDAETTRRESINTRCTTVLSTAGILGTLVVAASQLGLIHQGGSLTSLAWIVYIPFIISLIYLIFSIIIALKVQGDIQGEVFDPRDLRVDATRPLDYYNCSVAKINLLYGMFNWCLNNKFKYRLQSAQRCLRNGLIAIILAGALSPWALTSGSSGSTSALTAASIVTAAGQLQHLPEFAARSCRGHAGPRFAPALRGPDPVAVRPRSGGGVRRSRPARSAPRAAAG